MGWTDGGNRPPRGNPTGKDTLFCIDARSGRELWKQSYPCRYQSRLRTGDTGQYGGPSATPSYDAGTGRLYSLSVDGDLRCWDAVRDGRLVWAKKLYEAYRVRQRPDTGKGKRDFGFVTSPLIHGDRLIVQVGDERATVIAFDKATGRHRWASEYRKPAGHAAGIVPMKVAGTDCLALLALGDLIVMRADEGREGKTVATYTWQTDFSCNLPTPAAADGGLVLTSSYNRKQAALLEISPRGIRKKWSSREHAMLSSPLVYRNRVYLVFNSFRCLDLADGELKWRGGDFGHGNCILTAGDDRIIVFGNGRLALLDATGKEGTYHELARLDRVVPGTCYPHIALSGGVLCCKDKDGNLACFSVRPPQ